MNEKAQVFGQWRHLVGVSSEPVPEAPRRNTALLLLTPGMLHHVGPLRMHVLIARRLASSHFVSLRFCLSGIGESFGVASEGSSLERATSEIVTAMDHVENQFNLSRFVLFGLCSGADDAVQAALKDRRIVGLALMDGCGFPTRGHAVRKWLYHRPRKLWGRLQHALDEKSRKFRMMAESGSAFPVGDDIREFPERQQCEAELESLAERNVKSLWLYTGGAHSYFNGLGQFSEMFPRLAGNPAFTVRYYPHIDHVARLAEDRALVVNEVANWMQTHFPQTLESSAPATSAGGFGSGQLQAIPIGQPGGDVGVAGHAPVAAR